MSDLIGKKFNSWTVIGEVEQRELGRGRSLICRCDCGQEGYHTPYILRKGLSKSCTTCYHKNRAKSGYATFIDDLVGRKFGKWTLVGRPEDKSKRAHGVFEFECACGNRRLLNMTVLKNGFYGRGCNDCLKRYRSGKKAVTIKFDADTLEQLSKITTNRSRWIHSLVVAELNSLS